MSDQQGLFVKMALDAWTAEIRAANALLEQLTDEHLMREIAPGRNRGIYLLGHLTAVHDRMLPLLRFQEAVHPELYRPFHDEADKAVAELPGLPHVRACWKEVNGILLDHMKRLPVEKWSTRHANITADDFPREPHRNRLNVVLSRTGHLAYHRGQLVLLTGR